MSKQDVVLKALLGRRLNVMVMEADFTTLQPEARYNLIVSNPPYVRRKPLSAQSCRAASAKMGSNSIPAAASMRSRSNTFRSAE